MKRIASRCLAGALAVAAATLALPTRARAQEPAPSPVVTVGNTQDTMLFDRVTINPGDRTEAALDLSGFAKVSFLARAESQAPNFGRVNVNLRFGPPQIPVPDRLDVVFTGGTVAHSSGHRPILGPGLSVELVNRSPLPVVVSLGVYASK
jgi:hypothetical protein